MIARVIRQSILICKSKISLKKLMELSAEMKLMLHLTPIKELSNNRRSKIVYC